jgi:hypothetical protein
MKSNMKSNMEMLEDYYSAIRQFKKYFIQNCGIDRKYEIHKTWSHWMIRNLSESKINLHMIPFPNHIINDIEVIKHLISKGSNQNKVHQFYNQIITTVAKLYRTYHEYKEQLFKNTTLIEKISATIEQTETEDSIIILRYMSIYIKFRKAIFDKLKTLYKGPINHRKFYLLEMGFNYYILDGKSHQWSIPNSTFEFLEHKMGAKVEFFASPINVHLPAYCSLFWVDQYFGAMDSFFNIELNQSLEGVYELNPPFIERIFIRSSEIILKLLTNSQLYSKSLLFIYIMPQWTDSKGYQSLTQSEYLIEELVLKEQEHYYYQSSNQKKIIATFQSHILILGTELARKQWPLNEQQFLDSFKL